MVGAFRSSIKHRTGIFGDGFRARSMILASRVLKGGTCKLQSDFASGNSQELAMETAEHVHTALHLGRLATLLFMMMGPVGIMPTFYALARNTDGTTVRRIAVRAAAYAAVAMGVAVALGAGVLHSWGATPGSLIIAVGVILFLSALGQLPGRSADSGNQQIPPLSVKAALSPLAFPGIATPHAVGVLIIFTTFMNSPSQLFAIFGIALGIVVLDLIAMLLARTMMSWIGEAPLRILGAVFGVLQVALGIEFIISGIRFTGLAH